MWVFHLSGLEQKLACLRVSWGRTTTRSVPELLPSEKASFSDGYFSAENKQACLIYWTTLPPVIVVSSLHCKRIEILVSSFLFQILEQTCLFKHFHVSALLFLVSPWICGSLMCKTSTNIARLPVILNFALVLASRILFQTSSSEKRFWLWHLATRHGWFYDFPGLLFWPLICFRSFQSSNFLQDGGSPSRWKDSEAEMNRWG